MKALLLPVVTAFLGGCVSVSSEDMDDNREDGRDTAVANVPSKVLSAVQARVPGFRLTEAELHHRNGSQIYSLEGKAGGQDYDIDVTPGGRVVRIDN